MKPKKEIQIQIQMWTFIDIAMRNSKANKTCKALWCLKGTIIENCDPQMGLFGAIYLIKNT